MEEKDLEKLTTTKLREIAQKIEGITGVHAMKKEDLIREIHKARGETIKSVKKKDTTHDMKAIKKKIKTLKTEKEIAREKKDKKAVSRLRKKIKKHRRLTRKLACAKA